MPKSQSSNADKICNSITQLELLESIINKQLKKLLSTRIEIETIILNLEDSTLRRLMQLRYIQGLRFETIASRMSYSWQRIHQLHTIALNKIRVN